MVKLAPAQTWLYSWLPRWPWPQFSLLQNGDYNSTYLLNLFWGFDKLILVKFTLLGDMYEPTDACVSKDLMEKFYFLREELGTI